MSTICTITQKNYIINYCINDIKQIDNFIKIISIMSINYRRYLTQLMPVGEGNSLAIMINTKSFKNYHFN